MRVIFAFLFYHPFFNPTSFHTKQMLAINKTVNTTAINFSLQNNKEDMFLNRNLANKQYSYKPSNNTHSDTNNNTSDGSSNLRIIQIDDKPETDSNITDTGSAFSKHNSKNTNSHNNSISNYYQHKKKTHGQYTNDEQTSLKYVIAWFAFFILGTFNNFGYVVILTAAKSLADCFHESHLIGIEAWALIAIGFVLKCLVFYALLHMRLF